MKTEKKVDGTALSPPRPDLNNKYCTLTCQTWITTTATTVGSCLLSSKSAATHCRNVVFQSEHRNSCAVSHKQNPPAKCSHWFSFLHCSRVYLPGKMKNCSCGKHRGENLKSEIQSEIVNNISMKVWVLPGYMSHDVLVAAPPDLSAAASKEAVSGVPVRLRLQQVKQNNCHYTFSLINIVFSRIQNHESWY